MCGCYCKQNEIIIVNVCDNQSRRVIEKLIIRLVRSINWFKVSSIAWNWEQCWQSNEAWYWFELKCQIAQLTLEQFQNFMFTVKCECAKPFLSFLFELNGFTQANAAVISYIHSIRMNFLACSNAHADLKWSVHVQTWRFLFWRRTQWTQKERNFGISISLVVIDRQNSTHTQKKTNKLAFDLFYDWWAQMLVRKEKTLYVCVQEVNKR